MNPEFEDEWPGSSATATECVLNLWALSELIEANGQKWSKRSGFPSMAACNVMTILHGARAPLLPSTISERMVVTRGTMTGILQTLDRRGLIRRIGHPEDGRKHFIEATPEALRKVVRLRKRLHRAEKQMLAVLTHAEQEQLLDMVARLQRSAAEVQLPAAG